MPRRFIYLLVAFALCVGVTSAVLNFDLSGGGERRSSSTLVVRSGSGTDFAPSSVEVLCDGASDGSKGLLVTVGVPDGDGSLLEALSTPAEN